MSLKRRFALRLAGSAIVDLLSTTRRRLAEEWRLHRTHLAESKLARRRFAGPGLRLHLGCGNLYRAGWVNIDGYRLPPCTPDLVLDLRRPLPFADASCSTIYSEHFFEHLPYPESADAHLCECFRSLAPGGRLSIGVPDPAPVLGAYLVSTKSSYFDYFLHHPSVRRHLSTPMEAVNWLFRQGGEHHFIYDFESLEQMLLRAGFTGIHRRAFDPAIDSPDRRDGTLYVDAAKPNSGAPTAR